MLKKSLLAVALAFASSGAFAAAETYVMDNNHTQVEFSWNHFGFSNPVANFDNIEGSINYDADDITKSSVEVTIATSSINSHVKDFNEHLASADFFDVAKYPSSTFKSTSVKKGAADNKLLVSGDLTIHGVTKPVTIDATLNRAAPHLNAALSRAFPTAQWLAPGTGRLYGGASGVGRRWQLLLGHGPSQGITELNSPLFRRFQQTGLAIHRQRTKFFLKLADKRLNARPHRIRNSHP